MEVILVTILLVLLYEKPEFLVRFSNSTLGKICSVVLIVGVSQYNGLSAGILSTLIILVLRNTWLEGNTNITVVDEEVKLNSKTIPKTPTSTETTPASKSMPKPTPTDSKQKKCGDLTCKATEKCQDNKCVVSTTDQVGMERQMQKGAETNTQESSTEKFQ